MPPQETLTSCSLAYVVSLAQINSLKIKKKNNQNPNQPPQQTQTGHPRMGHFGTGLFWPGGPWAAAEAGKALCPPSFFLTADLMVSCEKGALLVPGGEEHFYPWRLELTPKWTCPNKPTEKARIFHHCPASTSWSRAHNLLPLAPAPLSCHIPTIYCPLCKNCLSFCA